MMLLCSLNKIYNYITSNNMPLRHGFRHGLCGINRRFRRCIHSTIHYQESHRLTGNMWRFRQFSYNALSSELLSLRWQGQESRSTCWKFWNGNIEKQHLDQYQSNHRPYSTGTNENEGEHVSNQGTPPSGVIRQIDFFEEPITFLKNVEKSRLFSIDESCLFHKHSRNPHQRQALQTSNQGLSESEERHNEIEALSSFDGMTMCIISRGSATVEEGNDGDGPDAKAMHASALAWGELLRYSWEWNGQNINTNNSDDYNNYVDCGAPEAFTAAPMLAVAAVAPVVAQNGRHYLQRIDKWLARTGNEGSGDSPPNLWKMACHAVSLRDCFVSPDATNSQNITTSETSSTSPVPLLTARERWHLHALYLLLHNNHRGAMGAYLRLLELYPGDLLGLSLALDVAFTLGDSRSALRAATNVSTYWSERDGGHLHLKPSHSGQILATALIAVGLASASSARASTAERLAESAITRDSQGAGGVAVWALSHCLGAEGRSSEMVSKLAGFDGTQIYESCGFLNFHNRMAGYGGIALLDQMRSGAGRAATRLYDGAFSRVLEYSGNDIEGLERGGEDVVLPEKLVPRNVKRDAATAIGSVFSGWFGGGNKTKREQSNQIETIGIKRRQLPRRTVEDVLCWLPPSPLLLTHATALLFRLTVSEGIVPSDQRWAGLSTAWNVMLQADTEKGKPTPDKRSAVDFMPLGLIAASILIDLSRLNVENHPAPLRNAMQGLNAMGRLMNLGQSYGTVNEACHLDEWRDVMRHLVNARDSCQRWEMPTGISSSTYTIPEYVPKEPMGWDMDMRQFLEYALCHAAMQIGDHESLSLVRAICSEGTTLRPNCPEIWWRYASVLDMLGDEVAAENARSASVSLGSGEGASF
ncbi:hypothetical protein ACHAXS_011471 [Conticribra weissflogii]